MSQSSSIYCDFNATTPLHPDVKRAMHNCDELFGNASSIYKISRQASEEIEEARAQIATSINADASRILFTGSGTESNNQVLKHLLLQKCVQNKPTHLIISAIEHSSVLVTSQYLEQFGIEVDIIPVSKEGLINIQQYRALFKPHTALVSIIFANNEIGSIQPIKEACKIAHEHGAKFHTDAVQAFGKINVDVQDLDVDFLSLSAHKIYAPKGVGALYLKDDEQLTSLLHGGQHERSLRAGTQNTSGIVCFGKAASLLDVSAYQQHTKALKDQLKLGFEEKIPDIIVHGHGDGLTNTLNVAFLGVEGPELTMNCDLKGIFVSTGSACSSGSSEPSHVIQACGYDDETNLSSVRFSLGLTNTLEEMDVVVDTIAELVTRMRQ